MAALPDPRRLALARPTARSSSAATSSSRSRRGGTIRFGRFVWVGDGTKIRCHEGEVEIGAKTVLGQECTISAYRRVRIGEQCVVADRAMFIDFDHGVVEVERPIRQQGIYKRDVEVGSNVWIGYGACVLRGVRVGDNSVIGTSSVVTRDVPANAVVGGVPAQLLRMREAPETPALAESGRALGRSAAGAQVTRPGADSNSRCSPASTRVRRRSSASQTSTWRV